MIIIFICFMIVIILGMLILKNAKIVKEMVKNDKLNNMVNKFPENIEICKSILKNLRSENVEIKKEEESKTSLYIATSNTIIIANIRDSFTRVQTIAHECLHSVQNRKLLLFNFFYSNLYLLYFAIISILTILGIIKNGILHIEILTIVGFIYYAVRSFFRNGCYDKSTICSKRIHQRK